MNRSYSRGTASSPLRFALFALAGPNGAGKRRNFHGTGFRNDRRFVVVTSYQVIHHIRLTTDATSMIVVLISYTNIPSRRLVISEERQARRTVGLSTSIVVILVGVSKIRKVRLLGHSGHSGRFASDHGHDNDHETQLQHNG